MFTATVFGPEEITYAWLGSIVKVEKDADGNVLVYGKVTDGTIDSDDQIVDPSFAKKALAEWYDTGANVRQMHATTLPPAGKGILLESKPDGEYVRTKVVEPTAIKLVDNEVYTGYSVGIARPRIERDLKARGGRITGGKIVEISLVDRPANPMAKFAVLKAMGSDQHLGFVGKVETMTKRDFDPNVGGGVDRDKMPESDFIDPDGRRFPIHSPGDIPDAVASFGRAKPAIPMETFRRRLTAIANRKGPEFVAALPDSWKDSEKSAALVAADALAILKGGGFTHSHSHIGPNGTPHKHEHTHAAGTADHSELHEGGPHAHSHPITEESVTDDQQAVATADVAAKAKKCNKCKGTGQMAGAACPTCGGTGFIGKADGKPFPPKAAPAAAAAPPAAPPSAPTTAPAATAPDADGDADGDENGDADEDDDKPAPGAEGAPNVGPSDGPDSKPAPAKKRNGTVEYDGESYILYGKGGEVLGTHNTMEAAVAQKAAVDAERAERKAEKQAKAAKRAEKRAAEKAAKKAAQAAIKAAKPKVVKTEKPREVAWPIRRAHDFACAAYDTESVLAAYPNADKADNPAIGDAARTSLHAELQKAIRAYSGKSRQAFDIERLSKALAAFDDLVASGEDLIASRTELNDLFKALNPMFGAEGGPSLPKPDLSIKPGEFTRPYITAGHQREDAQRGSATIPTTTHPVTADQFDRGPLTDGHQRYISSKLAAFHDAIVSWAPELCRMDSNGSNAFDRQGFGSFQRPPSVPEMPNRQAAAPTPKDVPDSAKTPGQNKGDMPSFVFGPAGAPDVRAFTEEDFQSALTKALEPSIAKIAALEEEVAKLSAEPDPSKSAFRGMTTVGKAAKVDKVATLGAPRKATQSKKAARIEYLKSLATSSDAAQRLMAVDRLARMGVDVN